MRISIPALSLILGAAWIPTSATTISLSGTVVDSLTKGRLSGVEVSLAKAGLSAQTSSDGLWSLHGDASSIAGKRSKALAAGTHLSLQDGHMLLQFEGHDLLGHARRTTAISSGTASLARTTETVLDTLRFSWKGSVRARMLITSYAQDGLSTQIDTTGIDNATLDSTWNKSLTYGKFTDSRDGNIYATVKIGKQTWMAQDLAYKASADVDSGWSNTLCPSCGRYYTWSVAAGLSDSCATKSCASLTSGEVQGVCPAGWHLASIAEWDTLIAAVGDSAMNKLVAKTGWPTKGTDPFGFRALATGYRYFTGTFDITKYGFYWTSTESIENPASQAWSQHFEDTLVQHSNSKNYGFPVRCLLNATSIDTATLDSTWNKSLTYGRLTDTRDRNVYATVTIGKQTWMAQNLDYKVGSGNDSGWCYNDSSKYCYTYGRYYNWATAAGLDSSDNIALANLTSGVTQGVCPSGWHLPTRAEWDTLVAAVGKDSAYAKLVAKYSWSKATGSSDALGFRLLPTGYHYYQTNTYDQTDKAFLWTIDEYSASVGWSQHFEPTSVQASNSKAYGFPVRCVKN